MISIDDVITHKYTDPFFGSVYFLRWGVEFISQYAGGILHRPVRKPVETLIRSADARDSPRLHQISKIAAVLELQGKRRFSYIFRLFCALNCFHILMFSEPQNGLVFTIKNKNVNENVNENR